MPAHTDPEIVRMAEAFGDVARALAIEQKMGSVLDAIVHLAVEHLDACEFAGISFVEKDEISSPASSDEVPRIVDAIQSETGEGPCLDAIKDHAVFITGDLRAEERWPQFSHRAHEQTGVSSVLSLRLFIEEDTMGSLNLYSSEKDAFDDSDVALGSVFAAHAAVAMKSSRRQEQLEHKAETRDIIGQAKGILMARSDDVTEEQAFAMLKSASSRTNVRLVEVARRIADRQPLQD